MSKPYHAMVTDLVKSGADILATLDPQKTALMHMAAGISGEAGELLDAVKKNWAYGKKLDLENVIEEIGDLEFYLEGLRQELCITREQCLEANQKKLAKRYGQKYSDEAAIARADKSIENPLAHNPETYNGDQP